MKRRDFLKGGLTLLGLGAMGCGGQKGTSHTLEGSRRDPSFRQGHRLWKGPLPTNEPVIRACEGLILGGGIAGLSAGWRWTRAGFTGYELLELEPTLGGNSRALDYRVCSAPIGAHYLPLPNTEARAVRRLLEEMDIVTRAGGRLRVRGEYLCHSRQERLFYQGSWHDGLAPREALNPESRRQLDGFRAHIGAWAGKRGADGKKIFALPLHYSSRDPRYLSLDKISFAHYAREQGWTDPFLLWYLRYACRDDFGGALENCSAWAGLHYFASRDGGGLGEADQVLVWPEGNARLARFLDEQQGGRRQTGALVLGVAERSKGVDVDYLDTATDRLVRVSCKVCLFCLPTFQRRFLMEKSPPVSGFHYMPWVTGNLVLDRTPRDLDRPGFIAWDNVLYDSPSLGYVVATHQMLATDPNLPTVWTWYKPFPDGDPVETRRKLLDSRWESWRDEILADLTPVHSDLRERCQRLDVTVNGHAMIRPSVDFIWNPDTEAARQSRGRVFFGHGDLSGMSLFEESQFRGVKAAEDALAHLGLPFETYL